MALRITYSDPIPPSPIRFIVDVLDLKTNEEYNKWMLQLERGATGVEFTLFSGTQSKETVYKQLIFINDQYIFEFCEFYTKIKQCVLIVDALRFASAVVEKSDGRTMFWKLDGNLQFGWKGRMLLYSATGIGTTKNKYEFGITLLDSPTGGRTRTAQLSKPRNIIPVTHYSFTYKLTGKTFIYIDEVLLIEFIEHAAYIGLINTLVGQTDSYIFLIPHSSW